MLQVSNNITTAFIFAAGFGKRMLPLTNHTPKPLLSVNGKPILEHIIARLDEEGIKRIIVNSHHLADQIEAFIDSRRALYPSIEFVTIFEPEILETAGGLVNAIEQGVLADDKPFFTVNGDVLWANDYASPFGSLQQLWNNKDPDTTICMAVVSKANSKGYNGDGDFNLINNMLVKEVNAKVYPYVFMGIQVIDPIIFQNEAVRPYSLSQVYRDRVNASDGIVKNIQAIEYAGQWLHIGEPDMVDVADDPSD